MQFKTYISPVNPTMVGLNRHPITSHLKQPRSGQLSQYRMSTRRTATNEVCKLNNNLAERDTANRPLFRPVCRVARMMCSETQTFVIRVESRTRKHWSGCERFSVECFQTVYVAVEKHRGGVCVCTEITVHKPLIYCLAELRERIFVKEK